MANLTYSSSEIEFGSSEFPYNGEVEIVELVSLALTLKEPIIAISHVTTALELTFTLNDPTVHINNYFDVTTLELNLTLEDAVENYDMNFPVDSLGLALTVETDDDYYIPDEPIVTAGCPWCGTFNYD